MASYRRLEYSVKLKPICRGMETNNVGRAVSTHLCGLIRQFKVGKFIKNY